MCLRSLDCLDSNLIVVKALEHFLTGLTFRQNKKYSRVVYDMKRVINERQRFLHPLRLHSSKIILSVISPLVNERINIS